MESREKCQYRGFDIVAGARGSGATAVAWGAEKIGPIAAANVEEAVESTKARVDAFWGRERAEIDSAPEVGPAGTDVLFAIRQLPAQWKIAVADSMFQLSREWGQSTYVRFGILGRAASGEAGKPNYQIESEDGTQSCPFNHYHHPHVRDVFIADHLTEARYDPETLHRVCGFPPPHWT